jgi:hypothetical protein
VVAHTSFRSTIIQEATKLRDETNGLAYFYCDYKDSSTLDSLSILGSLIRQFAVQNDRAFEHGESLYKRHTSQGKLTSQVTIEELAGCLQCMSKCFKNAMIVIDALDECGSDRASVVELLSNLVDPQHNTLKALFTSRKEIDIEMHLSKYDQISIAAMSSDLKLYVAAEIELRTCFYPQNKHPVGLVS